MLSISQSAARQLDKWVLYTMNRRVPGTFETSYLQPVAFETVLAQTTVNTRKTAVSNLTAPGEHSIWLNTAEGELQCHVRVRLAMDPEAPLVLYHHGFNEIPYYQSWRRLFCRTTPFPAHTVCIQAPYHANWFDPFLKGFASLSSVYQMFAGSVRTMELMQTAFENEGAVYTMAAGVSWGGITSLLYAGLFQRVRATAPMLASPNLAQVLWDIAALFGRPISVSQPALQQLLDFTPYYRRCQSERIFPLLAENDLFFRMESHAEIFGQKSLATIPDGHITGYWRSERLRRHVLDSLAWAEDHPL